MMTGSLSLPAGQVGTSPGESFISYKKFWNRAAVIFRVAEEFLNKSLTYYMLYIIETRIQYSAVMGG